MENLNNIERWIKSQIVDVSVPYITLDGTHTTGIIQVNKRIVKQTKELFQRLERQGFRINKIEPSYGRPDKELIENNITTGFNYRLAITPNWEKQLESTGPRRLSKHAWGLAIDINPRINPAEPNCGMTFEYGHDIGVLGDTEIEIIKDVGFNWGGEIFNGFWDSHHIEVLFTDEEKEIGKSTLSKLKFDLF
jgi:hypothetical protein